MRNGQQHHNHNHKRMRGRNRRGGGGHNPLTRVYESNGPDVKIRGTAHHIAEKYLQLARDAQSGGDPVSAESYLQHAEHYFRLIAAAQQQMAQNNPNYQQQPIQRSDQESGDEEEGDDAEGGDQRFQSPAGFQGEAPQQQQNTPRPQPQNMPQPNIPDNGLPAFITGGAPQQGGSENEQGGNRFNRNRGRNRFNNRPRNEGGDNREQGSQPQTAEPAPAKDPAE
ncbi:MAG: DUF4167 domain-containing protein [Xanthobacteraceae bacterium]|jgi:hypothetical protein|nr:DUF4167 domain-containing protein [Xanthobacteraceae bacterium]